MESGNLIVMIQLPSWLRRLMSKRSFEKWAGMNLHSAIQVKRVQYALRDSWSEAQAKYYGITRPAKKYSDMSNGNGSNGLHASWQGIIDSKFEMLESQKPILEFSLLKAIDERSRLSSKDKAQGRQKNEKPAMETVSEQKLSSMQLIQTEEEKTVRKPYASRPEHRNNEFIEESPQIPRGVSVGIYSKQLENAIHAALNQALEKEKNKKNRKKLLYLAPWLKSS